MAQVGRGKDWIPKQEDSSTETNPGECWLVHSSAGFNLTSSDLI